MIVYVMHGSGEESLFERIMPMLQQYSLLHFKIRQLEMQEIKIYTEQIAELKEMQLDIELEILEIMEPGVMEFINPLL